AAEAALLRYTTLFRSQENTLYQYVLVSNGGSNSSACTPGSMICAANGLPLKTRLLATSANDAPAINGGGPELAVAFQAAHRSPVDRKSTRLNSSHVKI